MTKYFIKEDKKMVEVHRDILDHLKCDKCQEKITHNEMYWRVSSGCRDYPDYVTEYEDICCSCIDKHIVTLTDDGNYPFLEAYKECFHRKEAKKGTWDRYIND